MLDAYGIGIVDAVYDAFFHNRSDVAPEVAQWTLKNNEWKKTNSEMVTMDEADHLWDEYYGNGELLIFEPVQ